MIVDDILSKARREKRTVLTEIEAKQILAEAGINCTDRIGVLYWVPELT